MARRGALTALQAVLAGISGGAGGYIQQQEMERRKQKEEQEKERQAAADAAGVRAEQRVIRSLGGTQVARAGEQVAGPMPSAIPLSGVGNAFAAAERAGGPATSRGALRQEVGGETFMLPSLAEMEAQKTVKEEATRERKQNALLATLRNVPTGLITTAERPLIEQGILSGAIDEKDIVNLVTGRTETLRRGGTGGKLTDKEIDKQVFDYVTKLAREGKPGLAGQPNTRYSSPELVTEGNAFRAALIGMRDGAQGTSAAGGGGVLDLSPQAAQQAGAIREPRKQAQAPMAMPTGGGLFMRDMFAQTTPAPARTNIEEVMALRARLRELDRGRFGGMTARDVYDSNESERQRVRAALAAAERR